MLEWLLQDPAVQEIHAEMERIEKVTGKSIDKALADAFAHAKSVMRIRVLGARWALPKVLAARSLPVTDDIRARIESESDLAQLESWLEAAAIATTIDDVLPPADRAR